MILVWSRFFLSDGANYFGDFKRAEKSHTITAVDEFTSRGEYKEWQNLMAWEAL